jgi:CelD/BcsL family acetyltransferase involved in cellulose biosynthesis
MKWKVHPASEFAVHQEAWRALNQAASRSPLLDPAFIEPLLREFGTGGEFLATCMDNGSLQAATLVAPDQAGTWHTFLPAQAPIGAWVQRPGSSTQELMSSLVYALPRGALRLCVSQQDPELLPPPAGARRVETVDSIRIARVTVAGSFPEYWEKRGKNLRANMKRQRSWLQKQGITTTLEIATDPAEVCRAIDDYARLECAGWKNQTGSAIHPENAQGRFYRAVLERFCGLGRGRIYRYRFDDTIVAMELCIEGDDSLIVLKCTYDESLDKVSPAQLMREEAFKRLFDEARVRRVEFYGELMDWHTRWTGEVRTMYQAACYRWSILSRLRPVLSRMKRAALRALNARIAPSPQV